MASPLPWAQEGAGGETAGVGEHQHRAVQVAHHLADGKDEDSDLHKADAGGQPPPPLHDVDRPHRPQAYVGDAQDEDERKPQ